MSVPGKKSPRRYRVRTPASAPENATQAPVSNLETVGDRLKVFSLQKLLTNKRSKDSRDVARLGDVLLPWFEEVVSKPSEKLAGVSELWKTFVPPALLRRTRLVTFHRGTLTVALDSATVRAELDAQLRGGLLRKLQTESRGTLFRVKTCVAST